MHTHRKKRRRKEEEEEMGEGVGMRMSRVQTCG